MYDELIKRLRNEAETERYLLPHSDNGIAVLLDEVADAIEQLSNAGSAYGRGWTLGYDAGRDENKPRWIPVTERLPKSNGVYLVNNGDRVWTCKFVLLGEVRGWANSARNPVVSAWMPLPPAPKEE